MGKRKKYNLRSIYMIIFIIIISLIVFLSFYKFPQNIDLEYPAVEFQDGKPKSVNLTTIKISGTLSKPLFRNSTFKGKVTINDYDFTKSYELIDISFLKKKGKAIGSLSYTTVQAGKPIGKILGLILESGDFNQLSILVNQNISSEYNKGNDLIISAPANNYNEAIQIYDNLNYSTFAD